MTYTALTVIAILVAVLADLTVGVRLLLSRTFWLAYLIIVGFQLIVNGVLTGLDVVRYDPDTITGVRLVYAPVEDLGFGFALTVLTLSVWLRLRLRLRLRPTGTA